MDHRGVNLVLEIPVQRLDSRKKVKRLRPDWKITIANEKYFKHAAELLLEIVVRITEEYTSQESYTYTTQEMLDERHDSLYGIIIELCTIGEHVPKSTRLSKNKDHEIKKGGKKETVLY
jgi:hypothetical protein